MKPLREDQRNSCPVESPDHRLGQLKMAKEFGRPELDEPRPKAANRQGFLLCFGQWRNIRGKNLFFSGLQVAQQTFPITYPAAIAGSVAAIGGRDFLEGLGPL